jgi:hypothetical protein
MKKCTIFVLALLLSACNSGMSPEQSKENTSPFYGDLLMSTAQAKTPIGTANPSKASEEQAPAKKVMLPALPAEMAPAASPRENPPPTQQLPELISSYFDRNVGRRLYIQVDKPLYKPGETIWLKIWDLKARSLTGSDANQITVELVSPKGATVLKKRLRAHIGSANNDFELPEEVQGGEYILRATTGDGQKAERSVIVSAYEAPRMKKKLEFVKKTYGEGEQVSATIEIKRPTGEALAGKALTAVITVDGIELPRVKATTNTDGGALVKFDLPKTIAFGDGLLNILVEDGGITESISKSIPIIQKKLSLAFFPEGGKMVAGLPTRLYFEAKTILGKPADVDGHLIDDLGNTVAKFSTYKNGLGRIEFTPATGRSYKAKISRPSTVTEQYALPLAEEKGCVLRTYDDFDGQEKILRLAVRCSERQKVVVVATLRENLFDMGTVEAGSDVPAVMYLKAKDSTIANAAGALRVTVFDQALNPLAERLVFRNRRARLEVKVEPDKKTYAPRDQVALTITTKDVSGKVVPAELALSVVDDTVISFADDKTAHLLSKLLLESELPGKIEEPNFYLDLRESKSALALDLLMGTRGYRRFDWMPVLRPFGNGALKIGNSQFRSNSGPIAPAPKSAPKEERPLFAAKPMNAPVDLQPKKLGEKQGEFKNDGREMADRVAATERPSEVAAPAKIPAPQPGFGATKAGKDKADLAASPSVQDVLVDEDFRRAGNKKRLGRGPEEAWAAVRVFPVPAYNASYAGPREDYRETVFWAPSIKTDSKGKATVKFTLSDAVTSFRVFSEGAGGGAIGRDETVFKSSLPFSLSVKLPLEVSAGDKPLIPVTLSNESEGALNIGLETSFGSLIKSSAEIAKVGTLASGQRKSVFIPLEVTGARGQSQVKIAASAGGLKDEVLRNIPVVPLGFPQLFEKSGQVKGEITHEIDLSTANKGSVQASVKVYTSPLSTMISGLDGMLREPSGCFEQTSSTNYPNVMIMKYMKQHDVADSALLERTNKLLDSGYKKLVGFEAPKKGYEWFGGDPGHEALTAYGVMQFADMKDAYGTVDSAMVARTSAWLKSRRDGNGGYLRDAKALDSFGRASPEVTDAYITWALVSAGETGLEKEIAKSAKLSETTKDAYELALATGSLLEKSANTSKAGLAAAARLANMQATSGAWTNADHSITRSGGSNLHVETTALAILALLKTDIHLEQARKGITWLQNNRSGFGQWGATQATVLALKAMIAFDNATRVAPSAGTLSLLIDGVVVGEQSYDAGRREAIVFADFDTKLTPGKHSITLKSKNGQALPYSIAVEYRSNKPASSQSAVVDLSATLAKTQLKMGETVRLDAVISNKTKTGQPMTLVRLGLPGGLTFQNWQLKELREKGQIAFFETRAREVILYFRDLQPAEVKKLAIDLVATVPGSYTGPASSAYLYYNDSHKTWASPLAIQIMP